MRSFEGYCTGIGVGISLATGAAVVLAVLSTILTVTDWTGLAASGLGRDVVLADSPRRERSAAQSSGPARSRVDVARSSGAIVLGAAPGRRDAPAATPSSTRAAAPAGRRTTARRTEGGRTRRGDSAGVPAATTSPMAASAPVVPDPAPAVVPAAAAAPADPAPAQAPSDAVSPPAADPAPSQRSDNPGRGRSKQKDRAETPSDTSEAPVPATRSIESTPEPAADRGGRGKWNRSTSSGRVDRGKPHDQPAVALSSGGDAPAPPPEAPPADRGAPDGGPGESAPGRGKPFKGEGRGRHRG